MSAHRRGFNRLSRWLSLLIGLVGALAACSSSLPKGRSEHAVRKQVPVPICLGPLAEAAPGVDADDTYWSLLWRADAESAGAYAPRARDCAGGSPLGTLDGSKTWRRADQPIVWSKPAGGLRAAWLPLRSDGSERAGLLALVGVRGQRHEVYALGLHPGLEEAPSLSIERVGPQLLVAASAPGCSATLPPYPSGGPLPGSTPCDAAVHLYALRGGTLALLAAIPSERALRRAVGPGRAALDYHFSAQLEYKSDGVHVTEQLTVRDSTRGDTKKFELKRLLHLTDDQLIESDASLARALDETSPAAP